MKTDIQDCFLFVTPKHTDERGYFVELYNQSKYNLEEWRQLNYSFSHKGVVRGMHITPFAKLVSCVKGRIFDVVIDPRPESPTYLKWTGHELSPENGNQLLVPPFCGHGFMALDEALVVYQQDQCYNPTVESSIHWQDPTFAVKWPKCKDCIVSAKDIVAPQFVR